MISLSQTFIQPWFGPSLTFIHHYVLPCLTIVHHTFTMVRPMVIINHGFIHQFYTTLTMSYHHGLAIGLQPPCPRTKWERMILAKAQGFPERLVSPATQGPKDPNQVTICTHRPGIWTMKSRKHHLFQLSNGHLC